MVDANATYIIVNRKSGTVLDLSGEDNHSLIGYHKKEGDNQKWTMLNIDGKWVFQNGQPQDGKPVYLGVGGQPQNWTPLVATTEQTGWDIWPDTEGPKDEQGNPTFFKIFVPGAQPPGQCVDLSDGGLATDGTRVTLWEAWNGENQSWSFQKV